MLNFRGFKSPVGAFFQVMMQKLEGKLSKIMEISQRISWFEQEVRGKTLKLMVEGVKKEPWKRWSFLPMPRKTPRNKGLLTTIILQGRRP